MRRVISPAHLRGDIFGGLTAGIIALPLALAFGVASGAGAAAGLYGAMVLGFFAAVFGGTRTQISGPTGPMTVVTASAVVLFHGDFQSVCMVVILAGLMQIGFGLCRVGGFVRFIPYPVISGFMTGIGVIIILLQLGPILGSPGANSPIMAVVNLPAALADISLPSLLLAAATMLIVFKVPPRISLVLPSPLIALVCMTLVAWGFDLPVSTIGEIPMGLPEFNLPSIDLSLWSHIAGTALALALLGTIDSLLTSIVADSLTKERHDSNRELIGQGIGNAVCGLVGGLPGAGATMRTVVNINAGGRTRLSGVVHSLLLLAVILGAGPLASHIPLAVLAGILIKVGVDILDYRLLKIIRQIPREDMAVMLTVFGITVFVDLIAAVAIGVTLAAVMTTWRISRQTRISISGTDSTAELTTLERDIQKASSFRIRVMNINGPFFFGTASQMADKVERLLGTRIVVVNCMQVPFIDISAVFALTEMIERLQATGIKVIIALHEEIHQDMTTLGVVRLVGKNNVCLSHGSALQIALHLLEEEDDNKPLAA
ncbi:MAG: SulP family inorganic anion transporter [Pseudodesulfovibrio sp.]|uniref:Sulphate transporter n=2 Tax=Pseudodesulfovibrio aespoeensis TaxID=182210 RepID=E6VT66_PSEA9|nr:MULTISPECIES: SulP family inorganic anion transporter [Pseudodesulfovibrio]MBU4192824.1 SulP family inorganic anion transporter [Pseudomonadota bacterium]ADU62116.1 sulphate transporter [Pseudodesulfovibrio aespoeensis Aspo-2]MBU4244335.1 SulP family inorganic anion transporter [Pseudomonadota bacterium]MBU4378808.1 SulP family inorganic anion transporter [Pseudomonadota bacterium]MBU4476562.1 SulP family inorganic anion transporter [Pseudomonadota bacterium]